MTGNFDESLKFKTIESTKNVHSQYLSEILADEIPYLTISQPSIRKVVHTKSRT